MTTFEDTDLRQSPFMSTNCWIWDGDVLTHTLISPRNKQMRQVDLPAQTSQRIDQGPAHA